MPPPADESPSSENSTPESSPADTPPPPETTTGDAETPPPREGTAGDAELPEGGPSSGPASNDRTVEHSSPEAPEETPPPRRLLSWPPPGLVRLQGDLWEVIRKLGTGGVVLVLPLLWITVSEQSFYSLGPLGESWWVILITSLFGLVVVVAGLVDLVRLLSRMGRSRAAGYGLTTILLVASDDAREAGFILQGARSFSVLGSQARRRVLQAQVFAALLFLASALWLLVGFVLGVLLASRGRLGPEGLVYLVLLPWAVAVLGALAAKVWRGSLVRRARRTWFQQPWSQDLARDDVGRWLEEAGRRTSQVGLVKHSRGGRLPLGVAAGAGVIVGLAIVVFTVVLTVTSAMSPVIASIGVTRFSHTQERAARAEVLRRYRVPTDESIDAQEGGQAFHVLTYVGNPAQREMELLPARIYETPWLGEYEGENPTGLAPQRWSLELFGALAAGEVPPEGIEYLGRVAGHPAHSEITRAAAAPAADISGARYTVPFSEGTSLWHLPVPKYSSLRQGAWARVGRAAYLARQGRMTESEESLKELVSAGLRLADEGPFLIDNLIGLVIADIGAEGLTSFYEYAGRTDDADDLRWAREAVRRTTDISTVGRRSLTTGELSHVASVVTDSSAVRGLRWEYMNLLNTLAPCLNLNRMVFGPDPSYDRWLQEARAELVRYPGEAELFEVGRGGLFGKKGEPEEHWLGTLFSIPLGGGNSAGSCAHLLRSMDAAGVIR